MCSSPRSERPIPLPSNLRVGSAGVGRRGGAEITRQADPIAYIDDFRLPSVIVLVCVPLAFLMRNPLRRVREQVPLQGQERREPPPAATLAADATGDVRYRPYDVVGVTVE